MPSLLVMVTLTTFILSVESAGTSFVHNGTGAQVGSGGVESRCASTHIGGLGAGTLYVAGGGLEGGCGMDSS